jgi:hypothetical protein
MVLDTYSAWTLGSKEQKVPLQELSADHSSTIGCSSCRFGSVLLLLVSDIGSTPQRTHEQRALLSALGLAHELLFFGSDNC